jgi:hypothetical protein
MVLFLSAWGAVRLVATMTWWDVLYRFDASLSPLYLSISGAAWAVAGLVLLWSIWAGKPWSYLALPSSVFLWLAAYWVERIFFQVPRPNLTFMIAATVVVSAITLIIMFNRRTKEFLLKSEAHEQPDQDPTSA